jgi:hypothetical protein
MPTQNELPDIDVDTLNAMIADLGRELGCPYGVNPDLVELGEIPGHVYGYNRGCFREGKPWDGLTSFDHQHRAAAPGPVRALECRTIRPQPSRGS